MRRVKFTHVFLFVSLVMSHARAVPSRILCEDGLAELSPDAALMYQQTVIKRRVIEPLPKGLPDAPDSPQLLAKHGYVSKGNPVQGGEAEIWFVEKDGAPYVMKAIRPLGSLRPQSAVRVEEKFINDARDSSPVLKERLAESEIVELDGRPFLRQKLFPRSPGSSESAPTLATRIEEGFPGWSAEKRIKVFQDLVETVEHLHAAKNVDGKGIIHRDLTPQNILVSDDGKIQVLDFGLSAREEGYPAFLPAGVPSGTPSYMHVNQMQGLRASQAEDIHALRKLGWQILAGKPEEHTFPRYRDDGGVFSLDFRHAPEVAGVDNRMAVVTWSNIPKTAKEYREMIERAQKPYPDATFYQWYGEKLAQQAPKDIALELLNSQTLMRYFPNNLGIDAKLRERVIMEALTIEKWHRGRELGLYGPHGHLRFQEFHSMMDDLHRAGIIGRPRDYFRRIPDPPNWNRSPE